MDQTENEGASSQDSEKLTGENKRLRVVLLTILGLLESMAGDIRRALNRCPKTDGIFGKPVKALGLSRHSLGVIDTFKQTYGVSIETIGDLAMLKPQDLHSIRYGRMAAKAMQKKLGHYGLALGMTPHEIHNWPLNQLNQPANSVGTKHRPEKIGEAEKMEIFSRPIAFLDDKTHGGCLQGLINPEKSHHDLHKAPIRTIGDLVTKYWPQMRDWIGRDQTSDLSNLLQTHGLHLGMSRWQMLIDKTPWRVMGKSKAHEIFDRPVGTLDLNVRARNGLERLAVNNIGELVWHEDCDLLAVKNFGRHSLAVIKEALGSLGLRLGMTLSEILAWKGPETKP